MSTPFLHAVELELISARTKHIEPIHSFHEGKSVIEEELDEFWEQVKLQISERDPKEMLRELVQLAAMCARTAEDLGLIPPDYTPEKCGPLWLR